jgi:Ca-activated chloride channel family protein
MLLIVLLTLCFAAEKVNYGSISGTVQKQGSKQPLSGQEVQCFHKDKLISASITSDKGFYMLKDLLPGTYTIKVTNSQYLPYTNEKVRVSSGKNTTLNIKLKNTPNKPEVIKKEDSVSTKTYVVMSDELSTSSVDMQSLQSALAQMGDIYNTSVAGANTPVVPPHETEQYAPITPNIFHSPLAEPLSTFSIDVDTANYSNLRRMLTQGYLPEPKSIRIEELLNYFAYDYPQPKGDHPFAVYSEMGVCPWNQKRNLVHIGIQGKKLNLDKAAPSNLVFLIDVSGSMNTEKKLPLVQASLNMLVENLRGSDKVAIVVYAGAAGEVLPSTSGNQKQKITEAINNLRAGGSTAGGAGIELAYKIAKENFIKDGNNRIIICTDGDFNVGASSNAHMTDLVEKNRKDGVYLTLLGYGMGNYKDDRMELLADKGNGNYAYIDNIMEAKKVLVNEMASTLYTIAKDVKLQIEFNPAHVKAYRLIGYENRLLNKEDFKDDTKDAGELGAGHNVTAVYEIIPMDSKEMIPELDELKYQDIKISEAARKSPEVMTVKLRYKLPDSESSIPFDVPVLNKTKSIEQESETFLFSSAVIGYGMLLQDSQYKAALTWDMVKDLAKKSIGKDSEGYRAEFLTLIDIAAKLTEKRDRESNRDFNKGY